MMGACPRLRLFSLIWVLLQESVHLVLQSVSQFLPSQNCLEGGAHLKPCQSDVTWGGWPRKQALGWDRSCPRETPDHRWGGAVTSAVGTGTERKCCDDILRIAPKSQNDSSSVPLTPRQASELSRPGTVLKTNGRCALSTGGPWPASLAPPAPLTDPPAGAHGLQAEA